MNQNDFVVQSNRISELGLWGIELASNSKLVPNYGFLNYGFDGQRPVNCHNVCFVWCGQLQRLQLACEQTNRHIVRCSTCNALGKHLCIYIQKYKSAIGHTCSYGVAIDFL